MALLSQSGTLGASIINLAASRGLGLSKFVSTGNEADLHLEDYLEYLAQDEDTHLIIAYIEGLREGKRFFRLAKEITATKPIIAIKTGTTGESSRAARSHTGALAGSDAIYTAAFRQAGVIRADDEEELCDVAVALLSQPLPRGTGTGILTMGGGFGVVTAEACEKEGLAVSTLEPSTIIKLDKYLPSRWPRRNPVDMAGPSAAEFSVIADLLWALIEDENLDFIFLLAPIVMDRALLASRMGLSPEAIKAYREKEEKNMMLIREKVEKYEKPVVTMWQMRGLSNAPDTAPLLHKAKVLVCANARRAARVLRYLVWYRQYLDATTGK
jgi:acyl-CoA synthetase (NDP forming)